MHWCFLLFVLAGARAIEKQTQPNIVMLFVDDLGYGDLGFTGHPSTQTPNLDKLAALGKRLTSWYSAYPVCSASRAALLTGRQPPRVGMPGVINSLSAAGLPLNETTVADYLRAGGYRTLAIGKWHQGQQPQYLPRERGFDVFHGLPFSVDDGEGFASQCDHMEAKVLARHSIAGDDYYSHPSLKLGPSLPLPLIRQSANESVIEEQPADLVPLTAKWWNTTREFLRADRDSRHKIAPKFAYIAFGHVHTATPNIYPEQGLRQYAGCEFQGLTGRGPFGDALAEVDWFVGQLVQELDTLGMAEDTLILFASDNGPSLRWGIGAGSVGPFIGGAARYANGTTYTNTGKGSTWEGGIRMPAFAYWPGRVAPHSRSDEVVSTLDVLPSLLKIAGLPPPPAHGAHAVDGQDSLADIVLSQAGNVRSKHNFLPFYNGYFGHVSTEIYAARAYRRYKAHWITSPGLGGGRWPTDAHSAPELLRHDPPLIFDVEADPSENFPLAPEQLPPGLLARLAADKAAADQTMVLRSIDMRFGFEWALCCGVGCSERNGTCSCRCSNEPLPLPPALPLSRL